MAQPAPGTVFLRALASAALREEDPATLAERAAAVLPGVFSRQKSLVLDVQFTGFLFKGKPLGGVDATLLRAAGQLIVVRVTRVGFTAEAREEDLRALFEILHLPVGQLSGEGVVARLQAAQPHGIYLSTSTGEVYRPPRRAPEAEDAPAEAATAVEEAGEVPAPAETDAAANGAGEAAAPPAEAESVEPAAEVAAAEPSPLPAAEPLAEAAADLEPEAAPAAEHLAEAEPVGETPAEPEPAPAAEASAPEQAPEPVPAAETVHAPEAGEPAAAAAAAAEEPVAETSAPQGGEAALVYDPFDLGDEADLSDFELLDEFPTLGPPAGARPGAAAPAEPRGGEGEGSSNDMFHFFRSVHSDQPDAEVNDLPALLHAAENPTRFDELAQSATRAALRLVRSDEHAQAVGLLDALVREAERPDRTRIFRDSAQQALRRVGASETLQHLADLLHHGGQERESILAFFHFIGGDAVTVLESTLFRTADAELRSAVFRHVVRMEGASQRVMARAMADPSPSRTRAILELVSHPEVDHEVALRWIAEAAAHPDGAVRIDAARHAGAVGGRGGLRVLLDLLNNDRDPLVRKATIQALGALNDAAAVPFLARVVGEGGDEEVQLAAIAALGRIGSGEALPTLLSVVNKRALFAGKTLTRPRSGALAAIARLQGPAAREVMQSLAGGKDAPVAAEAQRLLATMG